MINKNTILTVLAIIAVFCIWYFFLQEKQGPNPRIEEEELTLGEPINFSENGTLSVKNSKLVFTYGTGTEREVVFDVLSVCTEGLSASQCASMGLAGFEGKKALLDGNTIGVKEILVRKIRVMAEGETGIPKTPEDRFISWNEAVRLIQNCQIDKAVTTDALDVFLTLDTDSKVWTVEPTSGETSLTINQSKPTCGEIELEIR